jgi:geranylgeranyl diphosphate synthase type II
MDAGTRIETTLAAALRRAAAEPAPPRLSAALEHAVFPGGARVRPRLCLAVAEACDPKGEARSLADAAAAALELIHCASLVHDDLPCFDDAELRRGRPSVHAAHGEALAVLAGDSLIIAAFESLARAGAAAPARLPGLVLTLSRLSGMPNGICAGQGWESEPQIDLGAYHRAKTGALFVAATTMGALSAGADPTPWNGLGAGLGEAFQVADDLRDAVLSERELGKPVRQDDAHGRPSAVAEYGVEGAMAHLRAILEQAVASIPACPGEAELRKLVMAQAERLSPARPAHAAA